MMSKVVVYGENTRRPLPISIYIIVLKTVSIDVSKLNFDQLVKNKTETPPPFFFC